MKHITIIFLVTCLIVPITHAQNGPGPADYKRAVGFLWTNVNNKKAFNVTATPRLLLDSTGFWYVDQSRDKKTFTKLLFSKVSKEPLFDHARMAAMLTDSLHRPIAATELPFNTVISELASKMIRISSDQIDGLGQEFYHFATDGTDGHRWTVLIQKGNLRYHWLVHEGA